MDFIEMDFVEDEERYREDKEFNEIDMILQATRVDMTRLSVLMDSVSKREEKTYKTDAYYNEALEVLALLLGIFIKGKDNANNT